MDFYRVTVPDGSTLDEYFGSDNEAIQEATKANHGVSEGVTVERYAGDGTLYPTKLPNGGYRRTVRKHHAC